MTDIMSLLKSLKRPRILIRAARFGIYNYSRNRDLRRILKTASVPSPGPAIVKLMSEESLLESKRKAGDRSYKISQHVLVMIALMGEARLFQSIQQKA